MTMLSKIPDSKSRGGFRLFVSIADVAHYVQPNDPLDKEAAEGNKRLFPNLLLCCLKFFATPYAVSVRMLTV